MALGTARYLYEWEAAEACAEYCVALAFDPTSSVAWQMYATYLYTLGRVDEAVHAIRRAEQLDPVSPVIKTMAGFHLFLTRNGQEDERYCRRIVSLYPDYPVGYVALGLACDGLGEHEQAIAAHRKAVALSGGATMMTAILARSHALAGGTREARTLLDELAARAPHEYVSDYLVALVHSALGDERRAFDDLECAIEQRDGWLVWVNVDPRLEPLSGPRLEDLRRRVGLPRSGRPREAGPDA